MKIKYYENDLPENIDLGDIIAIDTETMGLNPSRDKLCLIQISSGNKTCHLVKILDLRKKPKNLIKLLKNNKITKIFHYARFDVAIIKHASFAEVAKTINLWSRAKPHLKNIIIVHDRPTKRLG